MPKDAECAHHASGERGLAQSGRPRRAKWHRGSSRDGKIAGSAPAFEGTRKGVAVVGLRSMKGASGRGSCSFSRTSRANDLGPFFLKRWREIANDRSLGDGGARGESLDRHLVGENTPFRGSSSRRSVWSAVKARHPPESTSASLLSSGHRMRRGCLSISCEWQLSIARISENSLRSRLGGCPKCLSVPSRRMPGKVFCRRKTTKDEFSPSHEGSHRAVDADVGGYRGERVRDARLRGRIRKRASTHRESGGGTIRW